MKQASLIDSLTNSEVEFLCFPIAPIIVPTNFCEDIPLTNHNRLRQSNQPIKSKPKHAAGLTCGKMCVGSARENVSDVFPPKSHVILSAKQTQPSNGEVSLNCYRLKSLLFKVKSLCCPAKRANSGENRAPFIFIESRIITFLVELQSIREGDTRQNIPEPKVRKITF